MNAAGDFVDLSNTLNFGFALNTDARVRPLLPLVSADARTRGRCASAGGTQSYAEAMKLLDGRRRHQQFLPASSPAPGR